jgi:hypothetical protein
MKKVKPLACDWMSDGHLIGWIEVTARYLAEAMEEARRRGLSLTPSKEQPVEIPSCSAAGCERPAVVWRSGGSSAYRADHDIDRRIAAEAYLDRQKQEAPR